MIALDNFKDLSPSAKVWIYPFAENLTKAQLSLMDKKLHNFVQNWTAHNSELTARHAVFFNHIIVLAVDEENTSASGCSIDKSVHFLHGLMQEFSINLFNRFLVPLFNENKVTFIELVQLKANINANNIDKNTLFMDNTVKRVGELETNWIKPINRAWFYAPVIA